MLLDTRGRIGSTKPTTGYDKSGLAKAYTVIILREQAIQHGSEPQLDLAFGGTFNLYIKL